MIPADAYLGARRLLEVCGALHQEESVAVVTDAGKAEIASLIAGQAAALGGEPIILVMGQQEFDGEEPPSLVAATMQEADLVIMATTRSLAHSKATGQALKMGTRMISIPNVTIDLLARGGIFADFRGIRPLCQTIAAMFTSGSELRIEAPGGTKMRVPIYERHGNAHDCIVDRPGMFTAVPNIEANVSPVEGQSEGTIVFDGSIPNFDIGVLHKPVTLEIKKGMVKSVAGGVQARQLERVWAMRGNPLVYNLAQVAIGLNPECHFVTGQLTNDHGVLQTMHFGIGTSENLGGTVHASLHMDGIVWNPTIWLDGTLMMKDGDLVESLNVA